MKIKPNKIKKDIERLLTTDQLKYIQNVLEQSCIGKVCISRSYLYEQLQEPLKLKIEQYEFESAITAAIKSGRISGFETRSGRSGGICRAGVFKSKNMCSVILAGETYKIPISEKQIYSFITAVLEGRPATANKGNIHINNIGYKVLSTLTVRQIIENFLVNVCKAEKLEATNDLDIAK